MDMTLLLLTLYISQNRVFYIYFLFFYLFRFCLSQQSPVFFSFFFFVFSFPFLSDHSNVGAQRP